MTDEVMNLCWVLEKSPDADLLRDMIGIAAQRVRRAALPDPSPPLTHLARPCQPVPWAGFEPAERLVARRKATPSGMVIELLRSRAAPTRAARHRLRRRICVTKSLA
jgi:hypothetical protein